MPLVTRRAQFNKGFTGKVVPRDKPLGSMPDAQNVLVTRDGTSLRRWPGFSRTYPYPLLNGLNAWKNTTTGVVVYSASTPGSGYAQDYGLRVVSVPPQALLLNSGRAVAAVDEFNGRILSLGYHANGNPLAPYSDPGDREPEILGRLFRLSKHEYPSMVYFNNKLFIFSSWNEPKVYDGETLRPVGIRAPQLAPIVESGGEEIVLDCDPTQWPNDTYPAATHILEDNPYIAKPFSGATELTDCAMKLPKAAYASYRSYASFWEHAKNSVNGKIYSCLKWKRQWGHTDEPPVFVQGNYAPLTRQEGVTFRLYKGMQTRAAWPILCQRNLPPYAFAPATDHIVIPPEAQSLTLNVYYDCAKHHSDATRGIDACSTGVLALVLSSVKFAVSGTTPYAPTADITDDTNALIFPITSAIRRKTWTKIEIPWTQESNFQLRSIGLMKLKDLPDAHFSNMWDLNFQNDGVTPINWSVAGTSEYYLMPEDGGKFPPDCRTTAYVDLTFNLRYKLGSDGTSFLYDDDYYFAFSYKNSLTNRESAPSPIAGPIAIKAGTPVSMDITGLLPNYPTGHQNTEPTGVDQICVYMARSQWGVNETTQEPMLHLLGEFDVPTDGKILLGTERTDDDILADRVPNYFAYSPPAVGLACLDGNRLLLAGQQDYSIGQVTVDSRGGYQYVTRVVDADPNYTPQFGPWCEGRTIHIEGQDQDGWIVKACPSTDGNYYSLLVQSGAEFLADASDSEEQETNDTTPRKYVIQGATRRMWWTSLTGQYGVDLEAIAQENYLDLDTSPDGINHIGHLGGIVCVTSRDRTLYLVQNMGALDDIVSSTGPAFSSSTIKPFSIGCLAGRTFQEVPGGSGSPYGAVWLTPDCGLAFANSEGIVHHPVSEVMRSFLRQPDKVSQFELQHAHGHYNKADGGYYLFFYSPAGDLLEWSDTDVVDPFVNWS